MYIIDISVKENIATNYKNAIVVCDNSNYEIHFQLDEFWKKSEKLFAKIIHNEEEAFLPVIKKVTLETGEEDYYIKLPPIQQPGYLLIGLFEAKGSYTQEISDNEENLIEKATSTAAKIQCVRSLQSLGISSNSSALFSTLFIRQEDKVNYLYEKLPDGTEVKLGAMAYEPQDARIDSNGILYLKF